MKSKITNHATIIIGLLLLAVSLYLIKTSNDPQGIMRTLPYRNACGHSDHENAVIEGNAAIRRAVLGSGNMELLRLYSDTPEFRQRLHREIIDET